MRETPLHRPSPPSFAAEPDARRLTETWDALAVPDLDGAWNELQGRLDATTETSSSVRAARPYVGSRTAWLRIAAAAVLVVGAGVVGWNQPVVVEAAAGEQRTVTLPDGSVVELNAGSSLRHARKFSWLPGVSRANRSVRLEGEAWFDVARDGRPFEVAAADTRIRVLGTAFAVRSRGADGEGVSVVVTEGRVAVSARGGGAVELGAGDGIRWDSDEGLRGVEPSMQHELAWRSGGFAAVDASLGEVLREASVRFGVTIDVASEVQTEERVTIYYGPDTQLERILADLVTARGLHYRRTATGWQVGP